MSKAQFDRASQAMDQLAHWSWQRIANPCPKLWPQTWVIFCTPGQRGMSSIGTLHGYLGDERAEAVRRAVRAGKRKGNL